MFRMKQREDNTKKQNSGHYILDKESNNQNGISKLCKYFLNKKGVGFVCYTDHS